jgi:Putative beta-barrel porin-2, OmpL-like. bbp2
MCCKSSSHRGCTFRVSAGALLTMAWLATTSVTQAHAPGPEGPPGSVSSANESARSEPSSVTTPSEEPTAPTPPLPQAATSAESEALRPPVSDPATKLLMKAMGWEESPVQVYGWIQNSFTGNANGTPRNLSNVTVFPNRLANQWQGNQYYVIVENLLEQSEEINLGFRFDTLFGNDWEFTKDLGLFDNTFKTNSFAGLDFPQIYGSVHLPWLTENGIDVKGGRFYSPGGFESPMAIYRPGLSVSNLFNYTVFTYFGMLSTIHWNDRVDFYFGQVNGPNRWLDASYVWNTLVGFKWTSLDGRTTITDYFRVGPDQLPYFPRADAQFPVEGFPPPPFMAGKRNVGYTHRPRYFHTFMLGRQWVENLNEVVECDFAIDINSPGFGPNGTPHNTYIVGLVHWLLYDFNPKLMGFWRSEVFSDPYGAATGLADTYYETTVGLRYEPKPWLWIRPEARYDWVEKGHPYADGTRSSQLTLAFDVIFLW